MELVRCNKKKGSLVIEAAVSVMILSMTAAFIVNAHIESSRVINSRILNEDITRNIENIKREIQYNVSKDELKDIFKYNELGLRYDKNFGNQILNKRINELDKGKDILIKLISKDEEGMKFEIKADVEQDGLYVKVDEEFEKSWWMDEN
ncbi:MAG: hypothetical protein Q4F66_05025 [Clostridium sp.]|nr:hypothetical protein [Clostridium sp.]